MLSDSKISTLESGFKNFRICLRIRRMRVDDSRIRKEKVADSKISGYVWTGPDWSSAGLISAVIVQLHTSCACNCTVVRVMPE